MQTQPKNAKKILNQEGRESSKPLYLRMCASTMDTPKKWRKARLRLFLLLG